MYSNENEYRAKWNRVEVAVTQEWGLWFLNWALKEDGWKNRGWGNSLTGRAQKVTNYIYRKKKLSPSKRTKKLKKNYNARGWKGADREDTGAPSNQPAQPSVAARESLTETKLKSMY